MEWQSRNNNNKYKQAQKHRKRLWLEILTVRLGLKASYIWDLSEENCHQIYRILDEINIDCRPTSFGGVSWPIMIGDNGHSLNVVKLSLQHSPSNSNDDDEQTTMPVIFYGNIRHMIENINLTLIQLDIWIHGYNNHASDCHHHHNNKDVFHHPLYTYLIDVSAVLNEPKIIQHQNDDNNVENKEEENVMHSLKYCLLHIRDQLVFVSQNNVNKRNNDEPCVIIHIGNHLLQDSSSHYWDLCAITGILLGYPIIYCNRTMNNGNCLANQMLRNYTIRMMNVQTNESYVIYSFTVPNKFVHIFQSRIDQWFKSLKIDLTNKSIMLKMEQKLECHPFILT
ncbi:hypothetical protein DERF_005444 [Dermatophagoides farinae]|uniref:Uncharacterized protein n=1 Tax=Dermatophagoides farinae TaxID=6954 RepID=A0A922L8P3_DERFA|nr:uncharacterized protein LOC124490020 [Dermatophagoides farinae]KAH7639522.1 hypothetical protein HUG17_3555 [Dermatophagoides farinae]KAH9521817.1 hypothetical protein DERF_005444 [Dermatophagoides farinae]